MTLQNKLDLYKRLRSEGNQFSGEVTPELVAIKVKQDFSDALAMAKQLNMKIHDVSKSFPAEVKAGMFNTDVLATMGEIFAGNKPNNSYEEAMYNGIMQGRIFPVVNATILLEVCEAKECGDIWTLDFTARHCYFLDSTSQLDEIATLTYNLMTKGN